MGTRLAVLVLAAWVAASSPASAGLELLLESFEGTATEREIVAKALKIAERECPELRRLIKSDVDHDRQYGTPYWGVGVYDAVGGWFASAPFAGDFGWTRFVGLTIQLRDSGIVSLDLGGGRHPGIASRTGGKYMGVDLCALGEGPGDYTFRSVPDLKLLDELE